MNYKKVIAVDLDGTITLTDTLYESILRLVRKNLFFIFLLPFWLIKGIAHLKFKVAQNCELDVSSLPYNTPLIDWLKTKKASGKTIVLCTAANERVALAVSNYLRIFDDVIASDDNKNLKSVYKRIVLDERFGYKCYDYAGNSSADVEVWAGASQAIVVNANKAVLIKASKVSSISCTFSSEKVKILDWCKALRIHQWLKNLLLFFPLLAAHQVNNIESIAILLIAFVSFSLCASSVYITNDLLDLESDRTHPRKKHRPFASAKLSIAKGLAITPLLIVLSIILGTIVGKDFLVLLLLYLILTLAYSLLLKRLVFMDCLILTMLYTVRIIAGAAAVSLPLSFWMLAFSVFIFLSLALVKRYAELKVHLDAKKNDAHGRGYLISDILSLHIFGVSSGYISVLVIALYIRSEDIVSLYMYPKVIWSALPILLFWVSWVWLKAARGDMHDDPIVFAVKDKISLIVAGILIIIFLFAATGMGI